jgi:hypothetical protein
MYQLDYDQHHCRIALHSLPVVSNPGRSPAMGLLTWVR